MNKLIKIVIYSFTAFLMGCEMSSDSAGFVTSSGTGGSLARFAIIGNNLYVVSPTSLKTFNISTPQSPVLVDEQQISFDLETIFIRAPHLFLGANTGMYIFDISNPDKPEQTSVYTHITSCDPVVVQGSLAYVTLRAGCGGTQNLFEIINIEDTGNPQLVASHNMVVSPYGLGISGEHAFICEGDVGLRVLHVADPENVEEVKLLDVPSYDIIIKSNGHMIVTGNDGLYQYQLLDAANVELLSHLEVVNED